MRFVRALDVAAPVSVLWAFHERPDVLSVLQPPWERAEVIRPPASLTTGTRVELRTWVGPFAINIEAEHVDYEHERRFTDELLRGPFRSWRHEHRFEALGPGASRLTDDITYELPGGALGRFAAGAMVTRRLTRLFEHRHAVTRAWCETVLHLAAAADWNAALTAGAYRPPSLASEGFIHCSTRAQLEPVARAFYAGRKDLVVLHIDAARLDAPVRWEDAAGPGPHPVPGPFPHVYGPIPLAAVSEVTSRP